MSASPSRDEILARITAVARKHLKIEAPLDLKHRLVEDLGFDSLKLLTLAAEVENEFRLRIEPDEEAALATVDDLVDFLERKLASAPARTEGAGKTHADRTLPDLPV